MSIKNYSEEKKFEDLERVTKLEILSKILNILKELENGSNKR